uniref:Uncharacterized protein n=1 Tax=Rhodnius prolixus TaxID=13249 RepID=T1ICD6_RHOPR
MALSDTDMGGVFTSGDESTTSSVNKPKRSSEMAKLSPWKGKLKKQSKKTVPVPSPPLTRQRGVLSQSTSLQQISFPQQQQQQNVQYVSDFATHNKFSVLPE